MSTYQVLCLMGIPGIIGGLIGYIINSSKKAKRDIDAVKLGIQALLRAQMIADYNKWYGKKYAPIYAKENFENVWQQYHSLGANGVMDDIHEKFLDLPTEPPEV